MKPLFLACVAVALALSSAEAATVTAQLSADETSVGVPVQLQVRVDGTTNVSLPNDLGVDGLQAQLTGRSTQVSIVNGRMTTSGIYSYTVIPLREGTFTIPALEVNADGRKLRTAAQTLVVQPGSINPNASRPAPALPLPPGNRPATPATEPSEDQLAYGELIIPRKSVYAGEVVPVELRFYFNGNVPFRVMQEAPQMSGEGFTVQKFSPAKQSEEIIGETRYHVLSFRTAITAVKAGEMAVPVASLQAVARVPSRAPAGMDDIFTQFFGAGGMPGFTDDREIEVKTKPGTVQVKPLPRDGRPANFSGAIGDFTVAATAAPEKVAAGDPVTLQVAITGRGNFDAMGEPTLVDASGWRTYPPTDRFEKSDEIGYAGTRTFEIPMIAQATQRQTPVAEFSFFDPIKEKFVTLRTQPVKVEAVGSPAVANASATTSPVLPPPTATPAAPAVDTTGWLTRETPRSWRSLVFSPAFWIVNGVAAAAYLALLLAALVRRSRSGTRAQRAAWQRDRAQALAEAQRSGGDDAAFLEAGRRALAIQATLAGESGPAELLSGLEARGRDVAPLRFLLARGDELKFSGNAPMTRLEPEDRRRMTEALKEVCR